MEKTVINSASNRRMKDVVRLLSKAKERREQALFVGEGVRMFLETPPARLVKVYVSESFYDRQKNRELLEKRGADYDIVSDRVFESISDTVTPQGILFLARIREISEEQLFERRKREKQESKKVFTYLVLNGIQDPGNLGTMLRAAEGAGITAILSDRQTADLYNPKVIRSTMGSVYRVPYLVTEDLGETIRRMKAEGIRVYAAEGKDTAGAGTGNIALGTAEVNSPLVYDMADLTQDSAFLIGNEGNGISPELAALADRSLYIPMEGKLESLNASMAAGILMYEAARQKRQAKM